jgi:hypothetical protein
VDARIEKAVAWIRANVAIGTIGSILIGAASYVGELFFDSYYAFYFVDGSYVKVPLSHSIASFVVILVLSASLVVLVVRSGRGGRPTFAALLQENVALFVLAFLLAALAIDLYWSNVETMSSWLSGMVSEDRMLRTNAELTLAVTHFLKRAILAGPLGLAAACYLLACVFRFSFARFVMRQSVFQRMLLFAMFILLALSVAGSAGKVVAFLEFTGVLTRPEITITHADGKKFEPGGAIYLVARADSTFFVARKMDKDPQVVTWLVPQASVRHIEFHKSASQSKRFLDYFK